MSTCVLHPTSKPIPVRPPSDDQLRVATIIKENQELLTRDVPLSSHNASVIRDILRCRTEEMRSHIWRCLECGYEEVRYNSCQNRYCPSCYAIPKSLWLARRKNSMLRFPHQTMTFVPPSELRAFARQSPKEFYQVVFSSASAALLDWAKEHYGARPGITLTLHTWTRMLLFFPHLHALLSQGGLSLDGKRWIDFKINPEDEEELQQRFEDKLKAGLRKKYKKGEFEFCKYKSRLGKAPIFYDLMGMAEGKSSVYVDHSNSTAEEVLSKQCSYIHRPPITDHALVSYGDGLVEFKTGKNKTCKIPVDTFLKRFTEHILPRGFHSTRHSGLYSTYDAKKRLLKAKSLLPKVPESEVPSKSMWDAEGWQGVLEVMMGKDPRCCPSCGSASMKFIPVPDVPEESLLRLFEDTS